MSSRIAAAIGVFSLSSSARPAILVIGYAGKPRADESQHQIAQELRFHALQP